MIAHGESGAELIRYAREVKFALESIYQFRGRVIRIVVDVWFIGIDP